METIKVFLQLACALGILNVWLIRFGRPTPYRGGSSRNMREEFDAYGLSPSLMYIVGGLKTVLALALILGIWITPLIRPAALGLAALMIFAFLMHLKIRDPVKKSLPAISVMLMSSIVALS